MLKEHFYIYIFIVFLLLLKFISYSTVIASGFPMFLPAINVLAPAETPKLL
jgi:hypothetical protein